MWIEQGGAPCTVIVTVTGSPAAIARIVRHAKDGLRHFQAFEGFIAGATHISDDGESVLQYLQWRSEQHHLNCMHSTLWDDFPGTRQFMEMQSSGDIDVRIGLYRVEAALPPPPGTDNLTKAHKKGNKTPDIDGIQAQQITHPDSPVRKHSVMLNGHATSVSLEQPFWDALGRIADQKGLKLNTLINKIDESRDTNAAQVPQQNTPVRNLSSTLRLYVLEHLQDEGNTG